MPYQNILVLSPHTDDAEFGCGAAISRFIREGSTLHYVAFSACEASVPEHFPEDILRKECMLAMDVLGIPTSHVEVLSYPVRHFYQYRQLLLETLIRIRNEINPDLVFIPMEKDIHQDHEVVISEAKRAFKHCNILGYELPWNITESRMDCFINISMEDLDKKVSAIKEYASQSDRRYADEEFIRGLAKTRGVQAHMDYAEGFQTIRWFIP